ncbi:MAG: right-handed parallel beta-helix repeat-containing protein [Fimbriimonadaceae bacterium]|nr:right-handed parallel beta-helix repeat-containing protein [Fimbriimonadaceae bacterium]
MRTKTTSCRRIAFLIALGIALIGGRLGGDRTLAVHAAGPRHDLESVFGRLSSVYLCGPATHETRLCLDLPDGRRLAVKPDRAVFGPVGGMEELEGRFVRLTGAFDPFERRFVAHRVDALRREVVDGPYADESLKELVPAGEFRNEGKGRRNLAPTAKKYLSLLVKFADTGDAEPQLRTWYDRVMSNEYPGIDHYSRNGSYQTIGNEGSRSIGWIQLPGNASQYKDTSLGGRPFPGGVWSTTKIMDVLVPLLDGQVDFTQYFGFQVFPHVDDNSGVSYAVGYHLQADGRDEWVPIAMENVWATSHTLAHEIGHNYGFDHASVQGSADEYASKWSPMGNGAGQAAAPFHWVQNQQNMYHKILAGWVERDKILFASAGANQTIDLKQSERAPGPGYQAIKVYRGARASRYYLVESRRANTVYDRSNSIPGSGVVIHDVDRLDANRKTTSLVVDADGNGDSGDAGAIWLPGETFTDAASGITISVLSANADGHRVRVQVAANQPVPWEVTSGADTGPGTLREAIWYANDHPGTTVRFKMPISDPRYSAGVFRIALGSPLPDVTADGTIVDGRSQTQFTGNTNANGPEVFVDGTNAGEWSHGFAIRASGCRVLGLAVGNFRLSGIWIEGPGVSNVQVLGCMSGLSPDGTAAAKNNWDGVTLYRGARNCSIGGPGGDRNVVSGNGSVGISLIEAGTDANTIANNHCGTNAAGTAAVPNAYDGIWFGRGPKSNTVSGNLISGNARYGVTLLDVGTDANKIQNNRCGTDVTGTAPIGNGSEGILVYGGPKQTLVADNVVSGNGGSGIWVAGAETLSNTVTRNRCGTNANGTGAIPNTYSGIVLHTGTRLNSVVDNLCSGNGEFGVYLGGANTSGNIVQSNRCGTNASGTAALPNGRDGILVSEGTTQNTIGGVSAGGASLGNLLSGNLGTGLVLYKSTENVARSNFVGTDATGRATLPNGGNGIYLLGQANRNVIGGAGLREGNLVSGNGAHGIVLGDASNQNTIQGNLVGVDVDGSKPLGNGYQGILLFNGSSANTIGGTGAGQANRVSACVYHGVLLTDDSTVGNSVRGNMIWRNGGLGILLNKNNGGWGVTPNDNLDADTGPNNLQNYPVLNAPTRSGGNTTVSGSLHSTPSAAYDLDFYAVFDGEPSGYGEGFVHLGTHRVTTDAAGNASFNRTFSSAAGVGVSATATRATTGDTSEFGQTRLFANARTVSGSVAFEDLASGAPKPSGLTVEFYDSAASAPFATWPVELGADGAFVLPAPGPLVEIGFRTGTWLRKRVAANTTNGNVTGLNVSLSNGDVNGDNSVNVSDFLLLRAAYGSTAGTPSFRPEADLNRDGSVGVADFLILRRNFGRSGQ